MSRSLVRIKSRLTHFWITVFWQYPHRLFGLKVSLAVMFLSVPFALLGMSSVGITLSLGAVAAALSETDDYPKGRIKSLAITLLSFLISSVSVEILRPYPLFFGIGLFLSSFFFIILGGIGERYRGITFGALLVAIYTMLGTYLNRPWYYQPSFLAMGGLFYGLVSLALLYAKPWRLLKEELALAYRRLADYTSYKANFFPSPTKRQDSLRNELAQRNIAVVKAIRLCRNALRSYANEVQDSPILEGYYQKWLCLQQMHERATSSHERYDLLSDETDNPQLIEGFGQLLLQLSEALRKVSDAFVTDIAYKHPISLSWTVTALKEMMQKHEDDSQHKALSLLLKNLSDLEQMLRTFDDEKTPLHIPVSIYQTLSLKERFRKILKLSNPRFRHAIRLSICLVIGYALVHYFKIEKGDWILLTSFLVCQQTYSETRQRLVERVLGTMMGVVLAVIAEKLLPTTSGQIVLLVSSIFLFAMWLRRKYAIAVIFITTYVLAAFNVQAGLGLSMLTPRMIDTVIGAFLAFLVVRFIWPDWQYKHLPELLEDALKRNIAYINCIANCKVDTQEYILNRQLAHESDTALTLAWRGIKIEPKKNVFYERKAFQLTYLNHAFLSYLSALGAHKHKKDLNTSEVTICLKIVELLNYTQKILHSGGKEEESVELLQEIQLLKTELREQKNSEQNRHLLLMYNIVSTTKELIEVTIQLKVEKNNNNERRKH